MDFLLSYDKYFLIRRMLCRCFCRAEAFIRNNNATDWLTASWFAIKKQENERNVSDAEVFRGF